MLLSLRALCTCQQHLGCVAEVALAMAGAGATLARQVFSVRWESHARLRLSWAAPHPQPRDSEIFFVACCISCLWRPVGTVGAVMLVLTSLCCGPDVCLLANIGLRATLVEKGIRGPVPTASLQQSHAARGDGKSLLPEGSSILAEENGSAGETGVLIAIEGESLEVGVETGVGCKSFLSLFRLCICLSPREHS